ncbi:asparaginase-domain-containing protein [Diplogelasinospora grovesii]|uniref:Asparaginase-domain-containing protein n=1 Tax=Diplogelasinospora grovesii TaxID=303347 RepID=A0AAN6S3Q4_9PEZI|nr:asparaginase-domain-containing protein [Diplogelasinospora grovesii]
MRSHRAAARICRVAASPLLLIPIFTINITPPALALPSPGFPLVINTWGGPFSSATDAAYLSLRSPDTSALDAVEIGCSVCEREQCDGTVGYGGSPDEQCETTLDAMVMDGVTMNTGAVAGLRRVRDAVSVARHVLEYTEHSMLVGDSATRFAIENGFTEEDLSTEESRKKCEEWKRGKCQGNFRVNVLPDPGSSCGPYTPLPKGSFTHTEGSKRGGNADVVSHDTISMVVIDRNGVMAAGTSTNGAAHKIPGRVGDGPIVGSGSYVDGDVGGCGATGDGDIMMRFLPCYQAVENLRQGMNPTEAAEDVVRRMMRKHPKVMSGVVVVDAKGQHGAAASNWVFTYSVRGGQMKETQVVTVPPVVVEGEYWGATRVTQEVLQM